MGGGECDAVRVVFVHDGLLGTDGARRLREAGFDVVEAPDEAPRSADSHRRVLAILIYLRHTGRHDEPDPP